MRLLLIILLAVLLIPLKPLSQVTTAQRISDSLTAVLRNGDGTIWVDTVKAAYGNFNTIITTDTTSVFDSVTVMTYFKVNGKAGFFGAEPKNQCILPYTSPPNPVTAAQARADYDLAVQNCFNQNGYNLYSTP